MADLSSILADPNYVNANAATKQAIFDKFSANDTNFTKANPATQDAIRAKFGVGVPMATTTAAAQEPQEPSTYSKVRDFVAPTVEMLGAVGGGLVGAGAGTLVAPGVGTVTGAVGGAGLGYGIAKEALNLADIYIGGKAPRQGAAQVTEPVRNVLEGATYEAGGRVLGQGVGYLGGKIADLRQIPKQKAAEIARNALGPDLAAVQNALAQAPANVTAGQATAGLNSPTWQALLDRAIKRDPRFLEALKESQGDVSINALSKLAGGTTATEVRAGAETTKANINRLMEPVKESALKRAALGQSTAQYADDAERLAAEAAQKVQDVRRFEAAKPRAETLARSALIEKGQPVGAAKYTYVGGDLPALAEKASVEAASGSLQAGVESRFAQLASDALRKSGIKPLETESLVGSLSNITKNPSFAGNDIVSGAVKNVIKDINQWTKNGIIDPVALDAVRKNSVNAAIQQLRPGVDASTQNNLAASVLDKVRPAIIDAIENAGGAGYREYLGNYTKAMQGIAEKKLGGEALTMFKTNPDAFVKLVQGETPEAVEKILGSGKYDIAKELSDNTVSSLQEQAAKVVRDAKMAKQVTAGQDALKELLLQQISKVRIPSYLNAVASTTNKALQILEDRIGTKTMDVLTKASQTPQGATELLNTLSGAERVRVLNLLSNPQNWKPGTAAAAVNALAPAEEKPNQNALRIELNGMAR
jgi:hypothetical protein